MKLYLLLAGHFYYPLDGTGDWIKCFDTSKEAEDYVKVKEHHEYFSKGKNKGQIKSTSTSYLIDGSEYEWIDIVDLKNWTFK